VSYILIHSSNRDPKAIHKRVFGPLTKVVLEVHYIYMTQDVEQNLSISSFIKICEGNRKW